MRSASECVQRSHRQCLRCPTHSDAEHTCRADSVHSATPDATRQSCLCRVRCAGVDDCSERVRAANFQSATVLSCRESSSHSRGGHDTDATVLSCLAWRCDCELAFVVVKPRQINVKDGILPVTAFPLELLSYTLDLENFAMHGTSVVARCCQL